MSSQGKKPNIVSCSFPITTAGQGAGPYESVYIAGWELMYLFGDKQSTQFRNKMPYEWEA